MKRLSIHAIAAVLAVALFVPERAHAVIPSGLITCRKGVAKSSATFVKKKLKAIQKCNEKNVTTPGDCTPAELSATIATLEQKLRDGIAKKCTTVPAGQFGANFLNYSVICPDANMGDGFTLADLQDCMVDRHEAAVDDFIAVEYNTPADATTLTCQKAIGKYAGTLENNVLKAFQKCRQAVDEGKLAIAPDTCASDPTTAGKVAKAETKTRTGITTKCTTAAVMALGTCADPACAALCGTCDPTCVADCIIQSHEAEISEPAAGDLIDYEYPQPPPPPLPTVCGDGVKNQLDEECDASDASACPGLCGAPASDFDCLCTNKPRQRVIEHTGSDLDNGWTGTSHDSDIVESGSYLVELYDCDGPGGPDTLCTVGPSCSGAPHSLCSTDAQCSGIGQGTCRKERTATGPHCNLDPKQTCACTGSGANRSHPTCVDNTHCPGAGNFCIQQYHGPPLPITAGGVPVCILNVFSEDVTGTRDLASGDSAFRLRQNSFVQVTALPSQPCPVCGGFCQAPVGGNRHLCTTNADCADVPGSTCITANVCNAGPNADDACRPDPPFGGPTPIFGTTSIDCPPAINGAGIIDILFNPSTTGTTTATPSIQCDEASFSTKTCAGGANNGADCTAASECPGGSCSFQCFCPTGGAVHQRPNGCSAACVGGGNEAQPCNVDSECPGGFCHLADCRSDPGAPAALQPHEGGCTVDFVGLCSTHFYRQCALNSDCAAPSCPECAPGETCDFGEQNCFINSNITRVGVPSPTTPVFASTFCIPATNVAAVDAVSGLPGPGALRQPVTLVTTGF